MQPEARISQAIRKAVTARGAFCFKVHGSEFMMAGLPDLVMSYRGVFIGVETKTPAGRLSDRQRYVHRVMRETGSDAVIVVATSPAHVLAVLDRVDAWADERDRHVDDLTAWLD